MKHHLSIALTLLISIQLNSQTPTKPKELPVEVVESINKRIANKHTPSMAIALIDSTGIYYFNFGTTTYGGENVDENSIYEIGSISKVFTGILLAQQIVDGDLKIDDEINNLLPDSIKVPVIGNEEITLGTLADHTSGLPRMPTNFSPANPNNPFADYTMQQMYEFISNYQPSRAVGSEYEYSNLAQGLLGHLLAENKNLSYEQLMIGTIADPLEMKETRVNFNERMKKNLAFGHSDGKVVENWDIPTLPGAGAIRSSTFDMAKFISANLGYIDSPLAEAMNLSHKIRHDKAGKWSVALGWHIGKGDNGDIYWHNGGTGGYRAFAGFVKETGKGVVVLTNSSQSCDDIGFKLLNDNSKLANPKFKSDAIELAESTLSKYVGVYKLTRDITISITKVGTQLYAQATNQERFEIYPETKTSFFLTEIEATISFQLKKDTVTSLILLQEGKETTAKKIE